nr:hypothetical protein CFP56_06895 [Quercus suber]
MDFHNDIDFIFPNDEPPFDSSSDDDELELTLAIAIEELNNEGASTSRRCSAQPCKFIWRNPLQGHNRLFHDYFVETPVYPPNVFRRRSLISRANIVWKDSSFPFHAETERERDTHTVVYQISLFSSPSQEYVKNGAVFYQAFQSSVC